MDFNVSESAKKAGEITGYIVMYLIFTIILYYILGFLEKIPANWGFFHIAGITAIIAAVGIIIARALK